MLLDHIVIRGLGNNVYNKPFPVGGLCIDSRIANQNFNESLNNSKNVNSNQANNNSFEYKNFEQIPNEFANNINYPTLDKIDYEAHGNYSHEGWIEK